jgi:branched-chain amino acid transport system ATP-binding protein
VLEVRQVHVHYGRIHALKGVSLNLERGEIVTLIGNNGAGKTTTLRAIVGLEPPSAGSVVFEGRDLSGIRTDSRIRLGMALAPEGRRIFPNLTVLENLEMGAYHRKKDQTVRRDFERVFTLFPRLKERRTQLGGTLSGGEQQMLAIGRALMTQPRLLLLDEPSLGLAPMLVQQIFQTIKEIRQQGTTVLLVEQNANMALSVADRGYVIETGEIPLSGTCASLLKNPSVQKAYLGVM